MSIARAILVILTAFSVAVLPVAGAAARVSAPLSVAAQAECCPPGEHCDEHQGDCTKDAACALECSSVSAVALTSPETAYSLPTPPKLALAAEIALSLAPNPPSPPPRV